MHQSNTIIGQQIRKKMGVVSQQDVRLFTHIMNTRFPTETPMKSIKRAIEPFNLQDFFMMKEAGKREFIDKLQEKTCKRF